MLIHRWEEKQEEENGRWWGKEEPEKGKERQKEGQETFQR